MIQNNGQGWKRGSAPEDDGAGDPIGRERTREAPVRALAIVSGKGGVGRSTIAVNLAVALSRAGRPVVLADGHLDLPNLDLLLGITPRGDLHDVVSGEREIEETLHPLSDHLRLLPGRLGSDLLSNLDEMRRARLVRSMYDSAAGANWLVIDTPPGLSRASLAFALPAREAILLTTPDPASVADAYATIKALSARRHSMRFRIVVNRAASEDEARRVGRRLSSLARRSLEIHPEYFGLVYEDPAVSKAAHVMKPFVLLHPEAPASVCIADIASRLAAPPGHRAMPQAAARREVAR